ncbi:unnamed protein product [Acanthoscelides obtectus]|uniref:CGG triplet repeat-binding protein 1 n=1 Tax=Acanthoscelides obtectus TaxID=200917 RepID=A0A9P0KTA5_ACAOB|nr:unnamed protein product [Acanthoscelides obtectus]CAK1671016.1 hypothetical protein AOBTE_LOCUS27985 [Acanthoscelides obtectus]
MSKVSSSKPDLLKKWIKNAKHLSTDGTVVYCNACLKHVSSNPKFQIDQHLATAIHKEMAKRFNGKVRQTFVSTALYSSSEQNQDSKNEFYFDLCKPMAQSNIPWNKLEQPTFRKFLEKYCSRHIPNESTLRKNYLKKCYQVRLENIREKLCNTNIYIHVDETTDAYGRYVANILVGILSESTPPVSYLINSAALEKTNHSTVARFINDMLTLLHAPNPVISENVKLMLSDAAAYMIKAGKGLLVFYPELIY